MIEIIDVFRLEKHNETVNSKARQKKHLTIFMLVFPNVREGYVSSIVYKTCLCCYRFSHEKGNKQWILPNKIGSSESNYMRKCVKNTLDRVAKEVVVERMMAFWGRRANI
jgi:hypothetical protein